MLSGMISFSYKRSSSQLYIDETDDNYGIGEGLTFHADAEDNIAIGENALNSTTGAALRNLAIGTSSLTALTTGENNVILGNQSGQSMLDCDNNTAMGYAALASATTGSENTAIGQGCLNALVTGTGNVALGRQAARGLGVEEIGNIAIGYHSMMNMDEGTNGNINYNIAIGYEALTGTDFSTGSIDVIDCIAIGGQALNSTSTNAQTGTIAIGASALTALTSGADNTAIGWRAGLGLTTGDANTFTGRQAGLYNITGDDNTYIGQNAGAVTFTDSNNTYIGSDTGSVIHGGNNVAVGEGALKGKYAVDDTQGSDITSGTNITMDGANAGILAGMGVSGVGLGDGAYVASVADSAANPQVFVVSSRTGTVAGGTTLTFYSRTSNSVAIGTDALTNITTGSENVAIGYEALDAEDVGSNSTAVGYQALSAQNNDTGHNTAMGWTSGDGITDGYGNTLIGSESGTTGSNDLTTGIQNTLVGQATAVNASGATNQTVIGRGTVGQADNSVTLGNASVTDVYMAADSGAAIHCGAVVHGLAAVLVTSSTLAYATHSVSKLKYVTVSADAQTLVLPAVQIGAVFIIVNIAADGGALLTIDPDGNDKFLTDIAGGVGTDGNTISNTKATQNHGDFVKLVGMSADGWAITEIGGIWADE